MTLESRGLREDLAAQREFLRSRAPAYASVLERIERELDAGLADRLAEVWRGREFGAFYERPLLLANALRFEALRVGESHPLWRGLARTPPDIATITPSAVKQAFAADQDRLWRALSERHLQTNETTRAVAWLWPARLAMEARPTRPIALFDVGASAGLNLIADHLPPIWEDENGKPLEVASQGPIVARIGYELRPLDVTNEDDALWLRACVWPGQPDREHRLIQSVEVFRRFQSSPNPPMVRRAHLADVPGLLPAEDGEALSLVYQTIVRDYVPATEWSRYVAGMTRWLEERKPGSALWVELEVTEAARTGGPPAAITAHLQTTGDGVKSYVLAHCEPHPQVLTIDRAAITAFTAALGGRSERAQS